MTLEPDTELEISMTPGGKCERVFAGWSRPLLPDAACILRKRYAQGSVWNMSGVLIVVPGGRAGRRLQQILESVAAGEGLTVRLPEIVTPAELPEQLYVPHLPFASPMAAEFAWLEATRRVSRKYRQGFAAREADAGGAGLCEGLAAVARQARDEATAEEMTLGEVAEKIAMLPDVTPDARWPSLVRLEQAYVKVLAESGLCDRNDARLSAVASGAISCERDLFLVGTVDLNGLERAMLRRLTTRVCAVIPAPPEEQEKFDDIGSLRYQRWQDAPLPIPDEHLHFVPGPADEACALVDLIAALNGEYARNQITIGVGNESAAENLGLRLAVSGLPVHSPFGRPLARVRPAALLSAVSDYLKMPTARNFAALVRHPDLELWLDKPGQTAGDERCLAELLDEHRTEHLPERLSDVLLSPVLGEAREKIEALLRPLIGSNRRLSQWAWPILDVLNAVFEGDLLTDAVAEDRQLQRGLAGLAAILRSIEMLPQTLVPSVSGVEALTFVLAQAETIRLPSDNGKPAPSLEMLGWLELALDDAPVLLLTGLHGGCVPADTGDDPLLPDSLRRRLGLADDRRRRARDGFLLRVMLESRACVRLIVTRRGADGAPQMPSRLLFACDGPTAARRAQRLAESAASSIPARPLFTPGSSRLLSPPRPQPLLKELNKLRVTAFRDYLACPYRFYLRHILQLEERDDGADEMDARLFGIVLHDTLASFACSQSAYRADDRAVADALCEELARQSRRRFGPELSPSLQLQVRQAGRRLDAFARWQAQSVREGWQSQEDLTECDLAAALSVDGKPFVVHGRLDRVDYCAARDTFRIIDYKTGDSGKDPDTQHRAPASNGQDRAWTDLQLPLYRKLLEAQGIPADRIEVGYVLLSADLQPVTRKPSGKHEGGIGFVSVPWTDTDYDHALACAEDVIRSLRAGVFWPPAAPPRFTDAFSGLCLDACRDRVDWLAAGEEAGL